MRVKMKIICTVIAMLFMKGIYAQINEKTYPSQSGKKHSISMCPAAVLFGIYSINYEYLHRQKHGIVIRFDYEDIPRAYTDAQIESYGYSLILNYRYHFSEQMNSYFVGAYGRYRQFNGEGRVSNTKFEFTMPDVSIGVNAGKKWVWKSGFTMTFALGYGLSNEDWDSNPNTQVVNDKIRDYRENYDFIDPFYGEFSLGYSF